MEHDCVGPRDISMVPVRPPPTHPQLQTESKLCFQHTAGVKAARETRSTVQGSRDLLQILTTLGHVYAGS